MMPDITLATLARANDAVLLGNDAAVKGVSIDSRLVQSGDLFVALRGERVDGHAFLSSAMSRGAIGAVVEQQQPCSLAQVVVKDSQRALAGIARFNRKLFAGPVIAVTGSAGKTTCKNMVATILRKCFAVCATEGNLNNELGVPLTVTRLSGQHDVAVIEMGAAQRGDIDYLTNIARPTISVLTNVNEAHVGRFGDLQTTAETKGEIFSALPSDGVAVVNADDAFADLWLRDIAALERDIKVITFSLRDPDASVYIDNIRILSSGTECRVNLKLAEAPRQFQLQLPLLGRHNLANAAAAIAVAAMLKVDDQAIAAAMSTLAPAPGRLELKLATNNLLLIDDSYNANPQAIAAAADVLVDTASARQARSVLVLGDMAELGEEAARKHEETGELVAGRAIDELWLVGAYAENYARGFDACCRKLNRQTRARLFADKAAIIAALQQPEYAAAVVLVKGSRSAAMDEVCDQLCASVSAEGVH